MSRFGIETPRHDVGLFSEATADALAAFQERVGLPRTGVLDDETWAALVEAGFQLGDRVLYLKAPMLRGDDVAALQQRLGILGFDAGRVDGIYGPTTALAVAEFQRNAGLPTDEMCGPDTVLALDRLCRDNEAQSVSVVREREAVLHTSRSMADARVVIGERGGFTKLTRFLARELRRHQALVLSIDEEDWSRQATMANTFDGGVFVGFDAGDASGLTFYRTEGFESAGGSRLAHHLARALQPIEDMGEPVGMRLPLLRETRMPAVLCTLRSGFSLESWGVPMAQAIVSAIDVWFREALPPGTTVR